MKNALLLSLALTAVGCGEDEVTNIAFLEPLTFFAMGDVPYSAEEEEILRQQIADLPHEATFLIHLGDIKSGASSCNDDVYANVAGLMRRSETPVFIIPGDNEWNDCRDPDAAWLLWEKHFLRFDEHWGHKLDVARQPGRQENFALIVGHVLVIGVNVAGGHVHDQAEWTARHAQCLAWIAEQFKAHAGNFQSVVVLGHARPTPKQQDFFDGLNAQVEKAGVPVLYLHGDGHDWLYDRPFPAANILRIQVDQGGKAPPLKVTVYPDTDHPFVYDRRLPAPAPSA